MSSNILVINHGKGSEEDFFELSVERGPIRVDFYLNFTKKDFYALFYKNGFLYHPKDNLFHAKMWETLKEHIKINLRDADFIYFIGILHKHKLMGILNEIEQKIPSLL